MSAPLNASEPSRVSRRKKLFLKGEYDARPHRKKRRLQPYHSADCGALRKGRPPVDTSVECGARRRKNYPATPSQRPALLRYQYPVTLDVRSRPEFYGTNLDDVPASKRFKRPCQER